MSDPGLPTAQHIVDAYNLLVRNIDENASAQSEARAYGGIIRSGKGTLVEGLARTTVEIAWRNLGGAPDRLSFEKNVISVPMKKEYIQSIEDAEIRKHILQRIEEYVYKFKTDVHVNIDGNMVIGIECKAYTENAMIKRIMVDFTFLKHTYPDARAVLFQLESQLGGDYANPAAEKTFGSPSTHTIMSYFDVDLWIVTLLEGERKVDRPIHKPEHYKDLQLASVTKSIKIFEKLLSEFI
ncbi:MAG: hypothetical protein RLZZ416_814 [Candidatus Parcubacteria bacterium]|jgi:hypothetical protein